MRVPLLLALLAGAALPALPARPAAAATPPAGAPCRITALRAEQAGDAWHGELTGGPVVAPGAASVSLTCAVHVGTAAHSGPAAVTATSPATPAAAVLDPRVVTVTAPPDTRVAVCTSATVDGTRWYYSTGGTSGTQWTTDPSGSCPPWHYPPPGLPDAAYAVLGLVLCYSPVQPRTTCDVVDSLLTALYPLWIEAEGHLCPVLADAAPGHDPVVVTPEGDVYVAGELWWDCPPYQPLGT